LRVAQHARLARLVRAQFELAQLESAAVAFQPQPSSLSDLVNDIAQKFQQTASAASVALLVEMPTSDVRIRIDVALIERVLENLISNAIRHTAAGGRVSMSVRARTSGVRVAVGA